METRAHHILIGLSAIVVLAAAMLFGLWLSEGGLKQPRTEYRIVFNESVSGLTVGGNVKYNGITVGEVTQLKLDPSDPRRVLARIRVSPATPVKQDTYAQIQPSGLLSGIAHIRLSGGSPESLPLLSEPGKSPEIPARPSPFAQLRDQSGDILTNINDLVSRMERLLSRENLDNLSHILSDMAKVAESLKAQQNTIATLLDNWSQTGTEARKTLEDTRRLITETRELLGEDATRTLDDTAAAAKATRRTVRKVETLVSDHEDALASALEGSANLGPALSEMRRTLDALRDLARRLESDAAGTLFNRDELEEYQP